MIAPILASVLLFASPASPRQLVTDEAAFEPFGQAVAAAAARELAEARDPRRRADRALHPGDLPALLTISVHWAIHRGDSKTALAAAEQLRARLIQPEQKAYAGVTTQALVAADEFVHHNRHSAEYLRHFRQEFAQGLAALPRTAGMRAVLIGQRKTIAALTAKNLIGDVEQDIPPGSHAGGYTLEQANEIIRARHKLADLGPLRPAMLEELDAAIEQRRP